MRRWVVTLTLVFSDVLLALLTWSVAFMLQVVWGRGEPSNISIAVIAANIGVWVGLRGFLGLYPGYGLNPADELRRQTYSVAAILAITSVFALAFHVGDLLSRLLLVSGFLGLMLLAPLLRAFAKCGMIKARVWGKPVVILGASENGARLIRVLKWEWALGLRPIAVFDSRLDPTRGALEGVPYQGTAMDALSLARKRVTDTIVLAMPHASHGHWTKVVGRADALFRYVIVIPNTAVATASAATVRDLDGILGVETKHNLLSRWVRRVKRALDLFGVLVGGLLVSPAAPYSRSDQVRLAGAGILQAMAPRNRVQAIRDV